MAIPDEGESVNYHRLCDGFAVNKELQQKGYIMNALIKDLLTTTLKLKGFKMDFEAKSDMNGGFECDIFSDGIHVVIIRGESVPPRKRGRNANMAYKYYYCQLGDDDYLKGFLKSEVLMKFPSALIEEYGGLFIRLINKIKSYGTKNTELLIKALKKNNDSIVQSLS